MAVTQIRAFKTSGGAVYESREAANKAEALQRVLSAFNGAKPPTGNWEDWSHWIVTNAGPLVDALAPLMEPHAPEKAS